MRMLALGLALLGCFAFAMVLFRANLPFSSPSNGTLTLIGGGAFVAAVVSFLVGGRD
jgi:hypothetical protein